MRTLLVALIGGLITAMTIGAAIIGIGYEPSGHVTIAAMTNGLGHSNPGTRPHHPRPTCRCN